MSDLESLLLNILSQLSKEEVSLPVAKELFDKARTHLQKNDVKPGFPKFDGYFTKKSVELAFEVLFKFSEITDRFVGKCQKGEVQPTHKELVLLARAGDQILLMLTYFESRHKFVFLDNDYYDKIVKSVQNIRGTEEKFLRQVHQNSPDKQGKSKKEFPWLWVIILLGGIILVLCGVIAYLISKKVSKDF